MSVSCLKAPGYSKMKALFFILSYLYGSLPFIFLLGKKWNINLLESGSGNVGATNLMEAGGDKWAILGWVFDATKGFLPYILCKVFHLKRRDAELAGVFGTIGQCWPVSLGFRGGRGISSFVGAAFQIDRVAWVVSITSMSTGGLWRVCNKNKRNSGQRSKAVPLGCFLGVVLFTVVAFFRSNRRDPAPILLSSCILLRRLTAELPDDTTNGPSVHSKALAYRLLYDRNTEY